MILKYISQLLKPTDTFRKLRRLKRTCIKQQKALKYATGALEVVDIEASMKLDAVTRHRFQRLYNSFLDINESIQ